MNSMYKVQRKIFIVITNDNLVGQNEISCSKVLTNNNIFIKQLYAKKVFKEKQVENIRIIET